ncbi:hypothetical protein NQZ68_012539 [Dissostichus eleginoides]|nr:hypothetical protein NQZ68_012539 [Dissostichus eleginoides]
MENFSVQWLSKGYYEDAALHSKVHSEIVQFTKKQYSPTSPNSETLDRHVFVFLLTSAELLKLPVLPTADSCGCTSDDSEGEAAQQLRSSGGENLVPEQAGEAEAGGRGPAPGLMSVPAALWFSTPLWVDSSRQSSCLHTAELCPLPGKIKMIP